MPSTIIYIYFIPQTLSKTRSISKTLKRKDLLSFNRISFYHFLFLCSSVLSERLFWHVNVGDEEVKIDSKSWEKERSFLPSANKGSPLWLHFNQTWTFSKHLNLTGNKTNLKLFCFTCIRTFVRLHYSNVTYYYSK